MRHVFAGLLHLVVALVVAGGLAAQDSSAPGAGSGDGADAVRPSLTVATKDSPPFAFKGPGGVWQGISIDLWRLIADVLEFDVELVEAETPDEIIQGVNEGRWDVGVGALSVTPDRVHLVEFTHPFYSTGLGVMVHEDAGGGFGGWLEALLSPAVLWLVGTAVAGLLLVGVLFWLFERKTHPQFQDGRARKGVGTGLWWSTVMFLGHKGVFPTSAMGRVVALSMMMASVILFTALTGAIASALTVEKLGTLVTSVSDLDRVRAAAVRGTSGAAFLKRERIRFEEVESVDAGVDLLLTGGLDALVHDQPLLEFLGERDGEGQLRVLPRTLDTQDYAFALQPDSMFRKRANSALLDLRNSSKWADIRYQYLGR